LKDKTWADNKEVNHAKDPNLQGGPDIDTTHLDGPSSLTREKGDLIGDDLREREPHVLSESVLIEQDSVDPSGDDPFVPNTPELSGGNDQAEARVQRRNDPTGEKGPTYERSQGEADAPSGGSSNPHNSLTHDSSGLVEN
jgi:hypothetical protein